MRRHFLSLSLAEASPDSKISAECRKLQPRKNMVSESDLLTRLREILSTSDLDTATAGSIRRELEKHFGVDLSDRKAFVRDQIDIYLESQVANPQDEEEGAAAEEEEEVGEGSENAEQNDNVKEEESAGKARKKKAWVNFFLP